MDEKYIANWATEVVVTAEELERHLLAYYEIPRLETLL